MATPKTPAEVNQRPVENLALGGSTKRVFERPLFRKRLNAKGDEIIFLIDGEKVTQEVYEKRRAEQQSGGGEKTTI